MADDYSAGTVWLQVAPSFHGLQDNMQGQVRRAMTGVGKEVDQQAGRMEQRFDVAGKEGGKRLLNSFEKLVRPRFKQLSKDLNVLGGSLDPKEIAKLEKRLKGLSKLSLGDVEGQAKFLERSRQTRREIQGILDDAAKGNRALSQQARTVLGSMRQPLDEIEKSIKRWNAADPQRAARLKEEQAYIALRARAARENQAFDEKAMKAATEKARQELKFAQNRIKLDQQAQKAGEAAARQALRFARNQAKLQRDAERGRQKAMRDQQALIAMQTRAMREDQKLTLDADTSRIRAKMAEIRNEIRTLNTDIKIDPDLDLATANARIAVLRAKLAELEADAVEVHVDVDTTQAILQLRMLEAAANGAAGGVSRGARLMAALDAGSAANSVRVFNGALLTTLLLGPALIPVLAGLSAGIFGVGAAALGALGGIGVLVAGLSGIGGAVKALDELNRAQRLEKAGAGAAKNTQRNQRQAVQDARAIADAQRNLARAREDAAKRLADANRRVADAEKSLVRAQQDAARAAEDANRRVKDAQVALADAREDAADSIVDAARRVSDAERRLADSRASASRAAEDAAERVSDAETRLARAQVASREAQEGLNEARQQAIRDLQDLNNQLDSARLNERGLEFALEEAAVHLNVVLEDDQATAREKAKAQLQYDEAVEALEQQRLETKRLEVDTKKANQAGVEGSDRVVDAKQKIKDTLESERDAEKALAEAREDQKRTAVDSARAIADAKRALAEAEEAQKEAAVDAARAIDDAERALADARSDRARTYADNQQSISDAEQALADARTARGDVAAENARTVGDAQRNLAEAHQDAALRADEAAVATGGLATATDNLAEAMRGLSPAGQAFATWLYSLKPLLDDLRTAVQEGFLPGLQEGMALVVDKYAEPFIEFMGEMAGVAGDLAKSFGEMLISPQWAGFFAELGDMAPGMLRQFGEISMNFLTGFMEIFRAFLPFMVEMGDWLVDVSESFSDWASGLKDSKGFEKFLDYLRQSLPEVNELLGNIGQILVNLFIGLAPYADDLLENLIKFTDWLAKMDPDDLARLALAIGGLVLAVQLLAGALSLISGVGGLFGGVLKLFGVGKGKGGKGKEGGGFLSTLFGGGKGKGKGGAKGGAAAAGLAGAFGEVAEGAGKAGAKIGVMRVAAGLLGKGLSLLLGPVGVIIAVLWTLYDVFTYLYENVTWFREGTDEATAGIGAAWQTLYDTILAPIFENIGAAWKWLQDEIIQPFVSWIWRIWEESVKPAFEYLYEVAIKPTMDLIVAIFGVVRDVVGVFVHIFREVFEHIVLPAFKWLYNNVIKPIMDNVGKKISWVWEHIIKPVFKTLGNFIEKHVAPKFEAGVKLISDIWAGVLDLIRAPIRGVINLVINKGLIGGFNWLAGKTGMEKLDPIPIPDALQPGGKAPLKKTGRPRAGSDPGGRYATGAILPGYTPGLDVHEFTSPTAGTLHLSGGEGILRPELVQALGAGNFNAANEAARSGRVGDGLRHLGGFAKGGILEDLIHKVGGGLSSIMAGPAAWLKKLLNGAIGKQGFSTIPKRLAKMAGGKAVSGLSSLIQNMFAGGDGGGSIAGGNMSRLIAGLTWWKDLGARVGEFKPWGPVAPVHMKNSMHYLGRAGDLNYGGGGQSAAEMKFFDSHLPAFRKLFPDLHVIWRKPGHFNHMHIDNSRGDGLAGGVLGGITGMGSTMVRAAVKAVASQYGWGSGAQWNAIDALVNKESSWNPRAANPTSSARGLFQKMTSIHGPVEPTPGGQAQWGLNYIKGRYGNPVKAWAFHRAHNYYSDGGMIPPTLYDTGGDVPPGLSFVANATRKPEVTVTNKFVEDVHSMAAGAGGPMVDARGSHFGADAREVARELNQLRSDRMALAGVRDIGRI